MKTLYFLITTLLLTIFFIIQEGYSQSMTKISEITDISTSGFIMDAFIKNNYLFVGGYTQNPTTGYLRVYDITNPAAPVFKTSAAIAGKEVGVMMEENNRLYLLGGQGLAVFDISDPLALVSVVEHNCVTVGSDSYCFRDGTQNIAKQGDLLFVNKNSWGMNVFDISNIYSPVYKDGFEFNLNTVRDYTILNNNELLLNDGSGLRSIYFSDPSNLVIMPNTDPDYVDLPGETQQWVISSNKQTAYVYSWGTSTSLISVVDIPTRTVLATADISSYTSSGGRMALNALENKLFIGTKEFDITNSTTLTYVGGYAYEFPLRFSEGYILARKYTTQLLLMKEQSTSSAYCSGTVNLTASSGTFTDGSGSSDYNDYSDCKWLIEPSGATSITLDFTSFDTETDYDFVYVYDGSTTSATLLGSFSGSTPPASLTSSGGIMLVHFTSDEIETALGWSASYTSVSTTGIKEIALTEVEVYPNPAQSAITIVLSPHLKAGQADVSFGLYNLLGEKVYEAIAAEEKTAIHIAGLPSGVYFLKITIGNDQAVKKILKQ